MTNYVYCINSNKYNNNNNTTVLQLITDMFIINWYIDDASGFKQWNATMIRKGKQIPWNEKMMKVDMLNWRIMLLY